MRILGVDPGLKATGYGMIEIPQKQSSPQGGFLAGGIKIVLLETGAIEPKVRLPFPAKLEKVYRHLSDIISQYRPDIMVLEKLYSHYEHPTTACTMGHVRGVIFLAAAHQKIELMEHSVKRIRKALIGNGSASKQQTREAVGHILKIDADQLTLDASDALALALGYAYMQRF